jgi:hypothetical protein
MMEFAQFKEKHMRAIATWILAVGLVVSPALAGTEGNNGKDTAAGNNAAKPAPATKSAEATKAAVPAATATSAKAEAPAKPESTSLEMELHQLRDLIQAQSQQLEEQRAALREQQKKMETLESELRGSHPASATATAAPDPAGAKKLDTVAAQQEELGQKVGKLETQVAATKKSMEEGLKKIGPFSFSGDLRLRDEPFFGGPSNQSQDRNRFRFRMRFNANVKLNDEFSGGISAASGDTNDPISTNQTTNQFYTRKPFLIDRAFINYTPHWFKPLTLTGGKFAYPYYRTELVWDNDLNPEGVAQTLAFNIKSALLKKVSLVGFELPFSEVAGTATGNKSIHQSAVYGGQIQTQWQLGGRVKLSLNTAFYNYHNADAIAVPLAGANANNPQSPGFGTLALGGSSVQNSVYKVGGAANTAQFASRFGLSDTIAKFDFDTKVPRFPVTILGDFVQNTRACANVGDILAVHPTATPNVACDSRQRRGYWLEGRFGRTAEKKDWQFAYTRMFIEREAVMGAFNFSDLRQNSNVSQHRLEVLYQAEKNIQLAFTGLFGRPLVTATSPGPAENILKRLQFDVIYKF